MFAHPAPQILRSQAECTVAYALPPCARTEVPPMARLGLLGLALWGTGCGCGDDAAVSDGDADTDSDTETDPANCDAGEVFCDPGCYDLSRDPQHCGDCDRACLPGSTCDAGECVSGGDCGADPTPPGGDCPGVCTGGCAQNLCTIDCGGNNCDGDDIVCPPGFACLVLCDGQDHCDSGSITCAEGYACTVDCGGGNDACGDQNVDCNGASSCSVRCEADACSGMQIDCSAGACSATCEGDPQPDVQCNDACSCVEC